MGQRIQTIDVHRNGAYHRIFPSETHESSSRLSLHAWNCMHQHAWCPFPRPCCITCPRGGQVSPLPHVLVLGPPRIKHRVNWQCQLGGRVQRVDWIRIRTKAGANFCTFRRTLDELLHRFGRIGWTFRTPIGRYWTARGTLAPRWMQKRRRTLSRWTASRAARQRNGTKPNVP